MENMSLKPFWGLMISLHGIYLIWPNDFTMALANASLVLLFLAWVDKKRLEK